MNYKLIVTLLSIITTTFFVSINVYASPYGVGKYNANVPYGGQTQLTISTSGSINIPINPSVTGTLGSVSGNITVVSTDVVGYKLYIRALTSTNLVNGGAILPASANGSPAALATNTWGYNLDASANFSGMTATDVLIKSATQPYTSGDITTVTYGVKIDQSKPAGNYASTVIYTAVPQTN